MKGDFTRFTFRPEKHYRSVRVQQGRVQLDADWNEQADIATHRDDAAAVDLIGRQGAPWHGGGFQVGQWLVPRTLYSVSFANQVVGFAVGADGTILGTTGAAWSRQESTTTVPLRGICAVASGANSAIALAVGDGGIILYTSNTGASWTAQSSAPAGTLHAVAMLDGKRAIAVGDAGAILETKNAPADTWSVIGPTAVAVNLRAVQMLQVGTTTHVFVVGDGGLFLHGSFQNPGDNVTWDQPVLAPSPSANLRLNGLYFLDDMVGVVVGELGTILRTANRGVAWTAAQVTGGGVTADLRGVRLSDPNSGVIAGDDGTILFTSNGTTWSHQASTVSVDLRAVSFFGGPWHTVGDASTILASQDGKMWVAQTAPTEWALSPGHLYVDGILCENERYVALRAQPDGTPVTIDTNKLIYLDVWERHLTAIDVPDLREVALGGPDTTTRVRAVWQVQTMTAPEGGACPLVAGPWIPDGVTPSTGQLAARAAPVPPVTDICIVPPSGGFRRLENQLYRIEIHDPGDASMATFTWSRDNGSTVARVDGIAGTAIKVANGGSPVTLAGFAGASVVEVIDDPTILSGKPGVLVAVGAIEDSTLTVADADKTKVLPQGPGRVVRRWESKPINLQPGQWIHLGIDRGGGQIDEEGIQVRFEAGRYNTGDYWVIPARTLSGSIDWPSDDGEALFKVPDGVRHHYCPLATTDNNTPVIKNDCRRLFPWMPDLSTLYYVGGDGQEYGPELVPGNLPLPTALQVAVPVLPATVRFTPIQGTIRANASTAAGVPSASPGSAQTWLDVPVATDGTARCFWWLDTSAGMPVSQQVKAVLLDVTATTRGRPIWFSATLSEAKDVFYDPAHCQALTGITSVQDAIDAVLGLRTIRYVGGDGQQALPYRPLPEPLQVGVASTCGPVVGRVRFKADAGGLLASAFQQLAGGGGGTNPFDADAQGGIAACYWLPDPRSKKAGQQVQAQLLDANGQPTGIPVIFTTSLSPGLHVTKLSLGIGRQLENDIVINPGELAQGVLAECDGLIDEQAIRPPILTITLDVPYPIVPVDRQFFGTPTPGPTPMFMPLVMAGQVTIAGTVIRWLPAMGLLQWADRLMGIGGTLNFGRVLARLAIYGNAIWSSEGRLNLDGDVFLGRDRKPVLDLPSGDGQLGGNFEMWFWMGK